jgi:hypothetical protein
MLLLVVIGFCIYGPQVLLVGTAPADLAHRGTSAAAAGFVNFMGYMGAAVGDVVTGYYSEEAHGGWKVAIYIWAGWAFAAAGATAILWNTTSRRVGLLPALVPKLAGLAGWGLAFGVAATQSYGLWFQILGGLGLLAALGSWRRRWPAAVSLGLALIGVVGVFVKFVVLTPSMGWHQSASLAAYSMAALLAAMVLVERRA